MFVIQKVVDVVGALKDFETDNNIYDPWAKPSRRKHSMELKQFLVTNNTFDAIVICCSTQKNSKPRIFKLKNQNAIVFDKKGL